MKRKTQKFLDELPHNLENKNAFITGANSGIGLATARHLAYLKANLFLLVRNEERGLKAKDELLKDYPDVKIEVMLIDLSSFDKIDNFIKSLADNNLKVDIFINNAGVYKADNKTVMMSNYLGAYYLSHRLLDYVNEDAKIIFTSSIAYKSGKIDLDDTKLENEYSYFKMYGMTKLLINRYYCSLLNNNNNIQYHLVHPGVTYSPLIKKSYHKIISFLSSGFLKIFGNSNEVSALASIYAIYHDTDKLIGARHFKGYPKENKLKKKCFVDLDKTIAYTETLINHFKEVEHGLI